MRVSQPFDGELIAEIPVDGAADVEAKLERATQIFSSRSNWLSVWQRIDILRRLARLIEEDHEVLSMLIAREGGKPLADAKVEVTRAVNGIEGAASHIERVAGTEIPMGLTVARLTAGHSPPGNPSVR